MSPPQWSLVDKLLMGLNWGGNCVVEYAENAILIHANLPKTVSDMLLTALGTIQQVCNETGVSDQPKQNGRDTLYQKKTCQWP
jgi:hypothetical protein